MDGWIVPGPWRDGFNRSRPEKRFRGPDPARGWGQTGSPTGKCGPASICVVSHVQKILKNEIVVRAFLRGGTGGRTYRRGLFGAVGPLRPVPPKKITPFPSSSLVRFTIRTCDGGLEGGGAFFTVLPAPAVLGADVYCLATKFRNVEVTPSLVRPGA